MATKEELRRIALDIAIKEVRSIEFLTVDEVASEQGIELSEDDMDEVHRLATRAEVTLRDD